MRCFLVNLSGYLCTCTQTQRYTRLRAWFNLELSVKSTSALYFRYWLRVHACECVFYAWKIYDSIFHPSEPDRYNVRMQTDFFDPSTITENDQWRQMPSVVQSHSTYGGCLIVSTLLAAQSHTEKQCLSKLVLPSLWWTHASWIRCNHASSIPCRHASSSEKKIFSFSE